MDIKFLDYKRFRNALIGAINSLEKAKEYVNELNVFPVPDGDTGTNMSLTMKSAVKYGIECESRDVKEIAAAVSKGALLGARGNSGVILSQLLRGFHEGLKKDIDIDTGILRDALCSSANMAYKAVMRPTEGTILTVAKDTAFFAAQNYRNYNDIKSFAEDLLKAMEASLNRTPELLPVLKEAGVVDAGGKGLYYIMKGAYEGLQSETELKIDNYEQKGKHTITAHNIDADIEFGYCTEFIIASDAKNADIFKSKISSMGDSMVVVGYDDVIKCHIHTNNPGQVLEEALKFGHLKDIKIDNMRLQHNEILFSKSEMQRAYDIEKTSDVDSCEEKDFSFIAVSSGEGFNDIFKGLGVERVVCGGQTMNPSTEDFMKAIDSIKANDIFILPNNKNIIMAAEQCQTISDKNISVIPTRTMPEGIQAVLAFDESKSAQENKEDMIEAIKEIKTGELTFAVRDTVIDGKNIEKGDYIAINSSKIIACSKDLKQTFISMIEKLIDKDSSLVSIYKGEDADPKVSDDLLEELRKKYDYVEFEVNEGKQPLYYYIVSIE